MYVGTVNTVDEIKQFFEYLITKEHLNFHPDENFSTYVCFRTGEPTFSKTEIKHYNSLMDKAFHICEESGSDIYNLATNCFESYMK